MNIEHGVTSRNVTQLDLSLCSCAFGIEFHELSEVWKTLTGAASMDNIDSCGSSSTKEKEGEEKGYEEL